MVRRTGQHTWPRGWLHTWRLAMGLGGVSCLQAFLPPALPLSPSPPTPSPFRCCLGQRALLFTYRTSLSTHSPMTSQVAPYVSQVSLVFGLLTCDLSPSILAPTWNILLRIFSPLRRVCRLLTRDLHPFLTLVCLFSLLHP